MSYRLPTEEEWEYAARSNTNNHFPWGNLWKEGLANIAVADENRNPLPINQAPNITTDKSPFGIFMMAGNISEWTSSSFRLYPNSNYKFKKSDLECKIIRGGNFSNAVVDSRTSSRIWDLPNTLQEDLGFRLAVSAK
ncbi:MAG: SUMF1/EgtB/PvdO family nonheme iron enzyme [Blastocatellia bacterium]|nr:SUMF1/EgtB/PvdO family nonheme iron enzyme [Blastocatellia bacterium]